LVAEANQNFAQAVVGFSIFEARGGKFCRREARRKFVDAVNSGDFFDEVNFARHVAAPGRPAAFPCGFRRSCAASRRIGTHGPETQSRENRFDLGVGDVPAHHAQKFPASQLDQWRLCASWVDIDDARERFAAAQLLNEFDAAA